MRWRTANRRKKAAPDKRAYHAFEKWADARFGPLLCLNPVLTPIRGSLARITAWRDVDAEQTPMGSTT